MAAFSFHGDEDSSDICHTLILSLARGGDAIGKDRGYGSIGAEVGEEALQWHMAMWVVVRVSGNRRSSARTSVVDLHDGQSRTFAVLESSGTRPA